MEQGNRPPQTFEQKRCYEVVRFRAVGSENTLVFSPGQDSLDETAGGLVGGFLDMFDSPLLRESVFVPGYSEVRNIYISVWFTVSLKHLISLV